MIEIVPDTLRLVRPNLEIAFKELDLDEFLSIQPLNFQFYYAKNGKAEVINTIYLEDGNPKLDLCLELFNESTDNVTLQKAEGANPAAGLRQCHFYIRFEKDLQLKPKDISVEPAAQWQVNYDEDDYFFTLYFLHKSGLVLKPKGSPDNSDRVLLTLKNLSANNRAVKSTNVELIYGSPLVFNGEGSNALPFTETLSCKNAISVTNHPDKKNIPLQFRFIGPNTVLNDGTTVNNLKVKIFNRPLSNNSRPNLLLDKANSKFIISFEANDSDEALTNLARANTTQITPSSGWTQQKTQNAPEWTIQLNSTSTKDKLTAGEGFELDIKNLVTSSASGVAYLYITYQNIGGYPDGQLVVPIEKTPLLYRQNNVGIGTTSPSEKLEIKGNLKVSETTTTKELSVSGKLSFGASVRQMINLWEESYGIGIQYNTQYFRTGYNFAWYKGGTHNDTALSAGTNGTVQMVINNGDVGIGTATPAAKLHVSGGNAIISGNVGIGTDSPSVKLHVNGRIKDKTGWVMPVGSILPYAGSTAPDGWFLCDGSAKDKTTYADLFSVISTQYGGSGSNFNLPNLKGRVPVGLSGDTEFNSLNKMGGSKTHTLTVNEMPSHNHAVDDPGHSHSINLVDDSGRNGIDDASGSLRSTTSTASAKTGIYIYPTGSGQAHNNLQPYITVNYIIKY